MKIANTGKEIQTTKNVNKVFYCKLIFLFFVLLITSSSVFSQEYLRIEGTGKVFRYFSNLKKTEEAINDSTTISIRKQKNNYNIKVVNKGKKNTECLYAFNGQVVAQNLRIRVLNKQGSKFVIKKIFIKILAPVNDDCITHLIPD
jgi:hypothetical protein